MKIAIPTFSPGGLDSTINPHFGKCDTVTFVTVEENAIEETNVVRSSPISLSPLSTQGGFVQHYLSAGSERSQRNVFSHSEKLGQ